MFFCILWTYWFADVATFLFVHVCFVFFHLSLTCWSIYSSNIRIYDIWLCTLLSNRPEHQHGLHRRWVAHLRVSVMLTQRSWTQMERCGYLRVTTAAATQPRSVFDRRAIKHVVDPFQHCKMTNHPSLIYALESGTNFLTCSKIAGEEGEQNPQHLP